MQMEMHFKTYPILSKKSEKKISQIKFSYRNKKNVESGTNILHHFLATAAGKIKHILLLFLKNSS